MGGDGLFAAVFAADLETGPVAEDATDVTAEGLANPANLAETEVLPEGGPQAAAVAPPLPGPAPPPAPSGGSVTHGLGGPVTGLGGAQPLTAAPSGAPPPPELPLPEPPATEPPSAESALRLQMAEAPEKSATAAPDPAAPLPKAEAPALAPDPPLAPPRADSPADGPQRPPEAPLPRQVAEGLSSGLATAPGSDRIELVLTPEELGRVRFELRAEGDSLHVTLTAERPDTMELLRRHLPELLAELRQAGYGGASLSFGQSDHPARAAPPVVEDAPATALPAPLPRPVSAPCGALDLRL